MGFRETLKNYNLKTDADSIIGRIRSGDYYEAIDAALPYLKNWDTDQIESNRDLRQTLRRFLSFYDIDLAIDLLDDYRKLFKQAEIRVDTDDTDVDDRSVTFEYVFINNEKLDVELVKKILDAEMGKTN